MIATLSAVMRERLRRFLRILRMAAQAAGLVGYRTEHSERSVSKSE